MKQFSQKLKRLDKVGAMMCGELTEQEAKTLSQNLLCEEMSPRSSKAGGRVTSPKKMGAAGLKSVGEEKKSEEESRTVPTKKEDERWAKLSYADLLDEVQRRIHNSATPGPYEVTVEHESVPSSAHEVFVGPTLGV